MQPNELLHGKSEGGNPFHAADDERKKHWPEAKDLLTVRELNISPPFKPGIFAEVLPGLVGEHEFNKSRDPDYRRRMYEGAKPDSPFSSPMPSPKT